MLVVVCLFVCYVVLFTSHGITYSAASSQSCAYGFVVYLQALYPTPALYLFKYSLLIQLSSRLHANALSCASIYVYVLIQALVPSSPCCLVEVSFFLKSWRNSSSINFDRSFSANFICLRWSKLIWTESTLAQSYLENIFQMSICFKENLDLNL